MLLLLICQMKYDTFKLQKYYHLNLGTIWLTTVNRTIF